MTKRIWLLFFSLFLPFFLFAQFSLLGGGENPSPQIKYSIPEEKLIEGEPFLLEVHYKLPDHYHQIKDKENFKVQIDPSSGILQGTTFYPNGKIEGEYENYYNDVTLKVELTLPPGSLSLEKDVSFTAYYQLCDDKGVCLFPQNKEFTFHAQFHQNKEGQRGITILKFLLLALIGGLLLNFMPCVFPLLSVKALNLAKQRDEDKKSIVQNALAYTLGIVLSFIALGAVIIVLKHSGKLLGWGFQFQSPTFLMVLISALFLFALSLFEVFLILPSSKGLNQAQHLSSKKGLTGSFFTGIFAVFVATPCTAPFLGTAMGFAFTQNSPIILGIMLFTGLGFSLPFLILGFFPKAYRIFPKPGKWMILFREAMAFLLLGTALYLFSTLIKQLGTQVIPFLWFLLFLSILGWLWGKISIKLQSSKSRGIGLILFIVSISLGGYALLNNVNMGSQSSIERAEGLGEKAISYGYKPFSKELLERALKENKPVFVALSAQWCTSCKINEKKVLYTSRLKTLFKENDVILIKGDLTKENPEATNFLYSFNRAGVPLYLLYLPGETVPRILPEYLSFDDFSPLKN